jgi:hypothetical protein
MVSVVTTYLPPLAITAASSPDPTRVLTPGLKLATALERATLSPNSKIVGPEYFTG